MKNAPEIYIHAVNPGFTVNGQSNVGELIEIARTDPNNHDPISLAGIIITYINSSGKPNTLIEFPSRSWMTGEIILLRLASSPESELADLTYTKTLAQKAGPLVLSRDDEILDSVCWTGKDDCAIAFKTGEPTTLIHQIKQPPQEIDNSLEDQPLEFEYIHLENYEPPYNQNSPGITIEEEEQEKILIEQEELTDSGAYETSEKDSCTKLQFSEILTYFESSQSEQFIELYNPTSEQILLNNCNIKYKNKLYPLEGIMDPDGYYVRLLLDFSLTKNPTTKNTIGLVDSRGETFTELTYYNGQKKSTSYALIGYDENGKSIWKNTFTPTPGAENIFQPYKPCEEGKVLNEETGNCVKPTTITETICKDGYYLNPETGRCKKNIAITQTEKTCQDGYYLNPLTNRCKKIVTNNGAEYPLEYAAKQEASSGSAFVALTSVIVLAVLAVAFVIIEFRREIKKLFTKVFHRVFHKKIEAVRD